MGVEQNPLPKDIPWTRLAFSPDMFDENFKDPSLPPKWRTSLAAFYYVVPEDDTNDLYPDRKLMYLRVVASITGVNLTQEGLLTDEFTKEALENLESNVLDSFQKSTLETIAPELSYYYPCKGAILQVAVFPNQEGGQVDIWNYPYIQDFEPKKREIYETLSKSGEMLSGSNSALNLKKGLTTTESLEESDILTGVSVKAGGWGITAETSVQGKWGTEKKSETEQSELVTTDSSQEKRETQSYTANINQMYQPLLAYHLGTNRALWAISARPHTVDSEFNLINVNVKSGEETEEGTMIGRQLEGIQDMFLVINMPKDSPGLCFQASLDTGYEVYWHAIDSYWYLVVMRRVIQSCGTFDENGNFKITYYPENFPFFFVKNPLIVNEKVISQGIFLHHENLNTIQKKTELVFKANQRNKLIMQRMLDGFSSRAYKPKFFFETKTFQAFMESSLKDSEYELSNLEYITRNEASKLRKLGIATVGDLIRKDVDEAVARNSRQKLLNSAIEMGKKIVTYQKDLYEKSIGIG
jgi:hypothetical protein